MKALIIILALVLVSGCATTGTVQQTSTKLPEAIKKELDISHFITFKAPPEGVEVIVVDTTTGKEAAALGTTPIRILILKKRLSFVDGNVVNVSEIKPIANAMSYGQDLNGGVQFQFKFRKSGFMDTMILVNIPYLMGDSEKVIEIKMIELIKRSDKSEK